MSIEERVKRIEEILTYQHGSLDLDTMKEKDEAFFKEANERLANINEGLAKNDVLLKEFQETREKRIASRKDLDEIVNSLKLDNKTEEN